MKNGGKNKSVAFIILFSIFGNMSHLDIFDSSVEIGNVSGRPTNFHHD